MPKRTTNLQHTGIEYRNASGRLVQADFRETDQKEFWLRRPASSAPSAEKGKTARVYRTSDLGERLIARFYGGSSAENKADATAFAKVMNDNYAVLGKYKAIVVTKD